MNKILTAFLAILVCLNLAIGADNGLDNWTLPRSGLKFSAEKKQEYMRKQATELLNAKPAASTFRAPKGWK